MWWTVAGDEWLAVLQTVTSSARYIVYKMCFVFLSSFLQTFFDLINGVKFCSVFLRTSLIAKIMYRQLYIGDTRMWNGDEMIRIGEDWNVQSRTCPSATLCTKNPTLTGLVVNIGPLTNCLCHDTANLSPCTQTFTQLVCYSYQT